MEFKTDENLPVEVCHMLRDAGHEASSVLDQQLGGRPDSEISSACKSEGRVLLTLDTDFGNILVYPPQEFPGIVVIRADDQSKATVLERTRRFLSVLESEPLRNRLWIVEKDRIRIRSPE